MATGRQAHGSGDGDDRRADRAGLPGNRQLSLDEFVRAGLLDGMSLVVVLLLVRWKQSDAGGSRSASSAGMGLLNKPSMAFFLVALLIGLLLTPQRTDSLEPLDTGGGRRSLF